MKSNKSHIKLSISSKEINNTLKETTIICLGTLWSIWFISFTIALSFNAIEFIKDMNIFSIICSITLIIYLIVNKLHEIKTK